MTLSEELVQAAAQALTDTDVVFVDSESRNRTARAAATAVLRRLAEGNPWGFPSYLPALLEALAEDIEEAGR